MYVQKVSRIIKEKKNPMDLCSDPDRKHDTREQTIICKVMCTSAKFN